MRSLIINRVKYHILTHKDKEFGADVPFQHGLNIIYGPNSVGKSSLITGIIYCLGGEKGLGIFQNKQNPFKPEFYDNIQGEKIKQSVVYLEISNNSRTVCLARSIIGKTDVVGLKECKLDEFKKTSKIRYLIASGEGAFSEDGLQKFFFDFLKWDIVNVPTYDFGLSKLYFENLLPLFFVEQRAGWSQIQARQAMRYNIRDTKKVAFEYLMGLDKFEVHLKEIEKRELSEKLAKARRNLEEKEESILVMVNGKIDGDVLLVERPGMSRGSIYDIVRLLEDNYNMGQRELDGLATSSDQTGVQESSLRDNLKIVSHQVRKAVEKINNLIQEIASYEGYIDRININKLKNKQLKKIENLAPELNISTCPVCENPLLEYNEGECKLCHHELKRKVSTPDENLEFLEDEKSSFEKILNSKRLELRKIRQKHQDLKLKEKTIAENIDHQISTYIGPQYDRLRKKVSELDILNRDIGVLKRQAEKWANLVPLKNEISDLEKKLEKVKKDIGGYNESKDDKKILDTLVSNFRENVKKLRLLKGKDNLISAIKIDETDFYTPYLEEYDLYNISSSSDNVRVVISYYLSMLLTSIELAKMDKIRFPNLLILDEPRQQNLDNKDLVTFIEILETLPESSSQVILTTFSEEKRDKKSFVKFIRKEMINEDDYLLKEIIKRNNLK